MNETTGHTIQARTQMTPCESSQIEAYGYDRESNTLAVRFRGRGDKPGALYHYGNFGPTDWQAFQDAESKGSHLFKAIKPFPDRYPYYRIAEDAPEASGE